VSGWLDLDAGRHAKLAAPPAQAAAPHARPAHSPSPPPVVQAQASPVPGKPLKIRLKIARAGSEQRGTPPDGGVAAVAAAAADPQGVLRAVRQLGADRPLSPIPASWAETLRGSPAGGEVVQQQAAAQDAPLRRQQSPAAEAAAAPAQEAGAAPASARQQQAVDWQRGARPQQQAAPALAAPAAAVPATMAAEGPAEPRAAKRPRPDPAPVPQAAAKQPQPQAGTDPAPEADGDALAPSTAAAAAESAPAPKRPRATSPPQPQPPSRAAAVVKASSTPAPQAPAAGGGAASGGGLAAVAAALPSVLNSAAATAAVGPSTALHELQASPGGRALAGYALPLFCPHCMLVLEQSAVNAACCACLGLGWPPLLPVVPRSAATPPPVPAPAAEGGQEAEEVCREAGEGRQAHPRLLHVPLPGAPPPTSCSSMPGRPPASHAPLQPSLVDTSPTASLAPLARPPYFPLFAPPSPAPPPSSCPHRTPPPPPSRVPQSCVKFLEVAATMEAHPAKFSREK
jgi:hypothetical protein